MNPVRNFHLAIAILWIGFASGSANAQAPKTNQTDIKLLTKQFDESVSVLRKQYFSAMQKQRSTYANDVRKLQDGLMPELKRILEIETKAGNLDSALQVRAAIEYFKTFDPMGASKKVQANAQEDRLQRIAKLEKELAELTAPPKIIPADAVGFDGHKYLRVDDKKTKRLAMKHAKSLGGGLARIESDKELKFVNGLIATGPGKYYIIDGDDEETEGKFLWSDGKEMSFLDWEPEYPLGTYGGVARHFVLINPKTGKMRDTPEGTRLGYVIEWEN